MAGFLAVTDDRDLTVEGKAVLDKTFQRVGAGIPSHAGAGRSKPWSSPVYNRGSRHVSRLRGTIVDAQMNAVDQHIVCGGDSKTAGAAGLGGRAYEQSYPDVLRRKLGGVEGFIQAEPSGNVIDDRWSSVGWQRTDVTRLGMIAAEGASGTLSITFAAGFEHTGGTWWVHSTGGGSVTVRVDGGAPQSATIPAGGGFTPVVVAGLSSASHTYVVETTLLDVHVPGFSPTYDGPRLKVSRVARAGSAAVGWLAGAYTAAPATSLWNTLQQVAAPDGLLFQIGTNQPTSDAVNATNVGLLWDQVAATGLPALIVAPGGLGGDGGLPISRYEPMYAATWASADKHDLPLVDFETVIGDRGVAGSFGLMTDLLHESRRGYAFEAAAICALLT